MFMIDQYIGGGQVRKYWSMSFNVNQITTPRVTFLTIVLSITPFSYSYFVCTGKMIIC